MAKDNSTIAIGIDLGTTYSCIAYIDEFGKPVILKNFENDSLTPSVVYFPEDSGDIVVGEIAKKSKALEPERIVEFIKRSIGRPDPECVRLIGDKSYRAEEISAYIVKKLIKDAEQKLDQSISRAVITCPAYFGINEREATAQAGIIAGLKGYTKDEKPNIIPEPTAAAFYYGLNKTDKDETILVYDLGGGTFDATLLTVKGGSVEAICIGGDHELGGKDWDDIIINYCQNTIIEKGINKETLSGDPLALGELGLKVEELKKSLTPKEKSFFTITLGGSRHKIELTRDKFNELTQSKLERTILLCNHMLAEAKAKGVEKFDRILLVGGSTRMPQIKNRLENEFPGKPIDFNDPDEAVAKGAALFAQKLLIDGMISEELFKLTGESQEGKSSDELAKENPEAMEKARESVAETLNLPSSTIKNMSESSLKNITSKSFGVVIARNKNQDDLVICNLIKKNSSLPCNINQTFSTIMPNQQDVELRIMENILMDVIVELDSGKEIGNAVLPLPTGLPDDSPVEVTFDLNDVGLLKYHGKDITSGNIIEGEIQTSALMSETELQEAKKRTREITIS